MELWCKYCNAPSYHQVRPWQTEAGKFGAISVFCTYCNEVTILNLKDGIKLEIPMADETS